MGLLDIHVGLQYQAIAPILGLEPIEKYTVNARCPYCGAPAWSIHQDTRNLEEWHYCSQCKKSGSILAMAAEYLELPESNALEYLAERLDLEISEEDLWAFEKNQDFRKRANAAWEEAQTNMQYLQREQNQYLQGLGWQRPATMGIERFLEGPGQLYGLLSPEAANRHLKQPFAKSAVVFAVVPYFRNLMDIGSFACFPFHREVFVSCPSGNFGFAGLPLVQKSQSQDLVVTSMLSPMIMLQMHHFSHSRIPLPLLASRTSSRVERQWSILGGRNLVLWERKPTAAIMHQAMMTDASITLLGPDSTRQQPQEVSGSRWWRWIHHEPAADIVQRLVRNARPYEAMLKNWTRNATPLEKTDLLKDAEQYSHNVFTLVRKILAPTMKTRIGSRVTVPIRCGKNSTQNLHGHTVIIERNGKWYSRDGRVRLSGILRISHLVARKDCREYVGWLESNGKRADFRVPVKTAGWSWLHNFAIEHGILLQKDNLTNQFADRRSENFCPFDAACRFQQPEVVRGLEQIGWDGEGFQFQNARLVQGNFRQIPEFLFDSRVPGPKQSSCRLTEDVCLSLCRDNPEMEATWALALAMASQVTTPCVNLPTHGIWVQRKELDAGLSMLYNRMEVRKGSYQDWPHRWPRRLDNCHSMQRYDKTNFFVLAGPKQQQKRIRELMTVDLQDLELQPRLFSHSSDKILLHYLRHFSQLQLPTVTEWPAWLEFTIAQFRVVFDFIYTDAFKQAPKRLGFC